MFLGECAWVEFGAEFGIGVKLESGVDDRRNAVDLCGGQVIGSTSTEVKLGNLATLFDVWEKEVNFFFEEVDIVVGFILLARDDFGAPAKPAE